MPMEETVAFRAEGKALYGILHMPEGAAEPSALLLMVVGGPQNRVGSHRSYTLMARELCRRGIPVLRFDYVGIGDSEGDFVGFAFAEESIAASVEYARARFAGLRKVIVWSLCDGSAACALSARRVAGRVDGMILCNPYVHSKEGRARTFLKYYYLWRALDPAFWKKLLSFQFNPFAAFASFLSLAKSAAGGGKPSAAAADKGAGTGAAKGPAAGPAEAGQAGTGNATDSGPPPGLVGPGEDPPHLPEKVMEGLAHFRGRLHLILSSHDFAAREFRALYDREGGGKKVRAVIRPLEGSDHTFSTREWKRMACDATEAAWKSFL